MTKTKDNSMAIILTLSLATLVGCMNMGLFNVALPALMVYFNTDVTTIQWISSGFTLAAGVITPVVGFLGDKFSYKKTLVIVSFATLALTVIGIFSWCIEALIVVRILFGLTAGMLMPLSMAMLYQSVPKSQQAKAAGIWGTANLVGGAIPSVLAGVIVDNFTWHMLLVMMIPLALLLIVCSIKILPGDDAHGNMKLDGMGFALTIVGSFVLLISFSSLSDWGFSAKFFAVAIVGLVCMALYVKRSWGKDDAMLNLSVLKYPRYIAALIADCMNIIALYMVNFLMPLFLQKGLGLSATLTGAIMLPSSLVAIVAMPFATKLLTTKGEKALALTGIGILLFGSSIFLNIDPKIPLAIVVVFMCIRCFGIAFMNLLTTNTAMAAVPSELSGHASSLTNWVRQIVSALIISIASTLINAQLVASNAQTVEEVSAAYLSSTSLLYAISCAALIIIIPIALKFFRGQKDM